MLEFRNIGHAYNGNPSVKDVSFEVSPGEVVTLLGPSGCGKTTLLRLAAGLERPKSGEIWLNDRLVSDVEQIVPAEDRGVGYMFQDYALFPHLTVLENVVFGLRDKGSVAMRRGLDVLAEANIEALADAYPHELSGGQQQRVALARALAPRPSVILLDEPYAGLDSRLRERIRDQMLHVLKASKTAALMVTHDAEEAMFMSDTIIVLRDGDVQQSGRPVNLYCQPNSAFVAEFFGEVNQLEGVISGGFIQTVLGKFAAPSDLAEGQPVRIVIRHEALNIEPDSAGANAFVMEARLLGRASLIHLSVPAGTEELHLHARVPGLNSLQTGSSVRITVDPTQAFVFPQA
ncbi:ABC transporter ATP-binding protein [Alphaproteobacteria bacterium]|jgi:iron(III) transport system ATP-binding protein|nr:ABC transporter ATP-binding protein [Alphaproteobacteria bacterium]NCF48565.1 ATP-binding cassette domain-containing protein [Bacteroidota bacterium]